MSRPKKIFKKLPFLRGERLKIAFWSGFIFLLGLFFIVSLVFAVFQRSYTGRAYPGTFIDNIDFSRKTQNDIKAYFSEKNKKIGKTKLIFSYDQEVSTSSAEEIKLGYNEELMSEQALSIGRSGGFFSNLYLISQAYLNGIFLPASYRYSDDELKNVVKPISEKIYEEPVDALFSFENGRVTTFRPSKNGQDIDMEELERKIDSMLLAIVTSKDEEFIIEIPVREIKPKITTQEVNDYGITELLGMGESLFQGSIQERVFNITLAANRVNGVLVPPGEIFSFNKALGDVSSFTGYKQAYVIQNGRTVLGDGGGVCQVSTTLFRAILNAGLPIEERHAHAYRVGYYEQDSPPGFDATIYVPSVDLKFKNDTKNHILIQTLIDPYYYKLTFMLYGTSDGRQVSVSQPVISSQVPAPEPRYEDDPTLPKDTIKQVDFAAPGAKVYFQRKVTKNGQTIIDETFSSSYRPWQAVFLKGTKE